MNNPSELGSALEVTPGRAVFGGMLHRMLPMRHRRQVGAWTFIDAGGPNPVGPEGFSVGAHPHCGLQTCSWFIEGAGLHRDSLGDSQTTKSEEMLLMTAGRGITHAERSAPGVTRFHGCQLWIALPNSQRNMAPRVDHFSGLPQGPIAGIDTTVFVGALGELTSPAPVYSPLVGAVLRLSESAQALPLDPSFEHCVFALQGRVVMEGRQLAQGELAYLEPGCRSLKLEGPGQAMLLGGEPLGEDILMWWNFVARTGVEMAEARAQWLSGDDRFPEVVGGWSDVPRLKCPDLPAGMATMG